MSENRFKYEEEGCEDFLLKVISVAFGFAGALITLVALALMIRGGV